MNGLRNLRQTRDRDGSVAFLQDVRMACIGIWAIVPKLFAQLRYQMVLIWWILSTRSLIVAQTQGHTHTHTHTTTQTNPHTHKHTHLARPTAYLPLLGMYCSSSNVHKTLHTHSQTHARTHSVVTAKQPNVLTYAAWVCLGNSVLSERCHRSHAAKVSIVMF